jgi:ABC-2 type transport system permease protein
MRKFLSIVRHEFKKIVLKWSFLISTLLFPVLAAILAMIPLIIFSLRGEPTQIAVADPTGNILPRLRANLSAERLMEKARQAASEQFKDFSGSQEKAMQNDAAMFMENIVLVPYDTTGKTVEQSRTDLLAKIKADEVDAYLIVPQSLDQQFEFRSRKGGDFVTNDTFTDALNAAVRSQRLAEANISEQRLTELSAKVKIDAKGIDETGAERDTTGTFIAAFAIGLMIYVTLAIYGQVIMGAVVEEKETRIAEILFSSARPFELMFGKLVGVGLAGLTQLSIWLTSAVVILGVAASQTDLGPILGLAPKITPFMLILFLIFFLLGFFLYASIFALIGSMVTSMQEGSQFAFPPVLIMLAGFYFSFAVVRDPNSTLSVLVSIAPFLAPITMPVRILAEMPPFWQIGLSILVNVATIAALVWVAARVYRVGMLMYGKRATIPEVWKWVRHA